MTVDQSHVQRALSFLVSAPVPCSEDLVQPPRAPPLRGRAMNESALLAILLSLASAAGYAL
ncbi:hypothetical protein, partial [Streptomyces xanthochromogenes]